MNLGGAVRINKCALGIILVFGFLIILYAFGGSGPGSGPDQPGYFGRFVNPADIPFQFPLSSSSSSSTSHNKVSLKSVLVAAINVAKRGGLEVAQVRNGAAKLEENIKGKTKEGVKDSATQGDYRSHRVMYFGLRKAFPGIKVISEEHTDAPDLSEVPMPQLVDEEITKLVVNDEILNADEVVIWIDPLDATKEYTENLVQYVTTMVGVAVKGKPIIGVIHRPFAKDLDDQTYWAVVGNGHSPNLNKIIENLDHSLPEKQPLKLIVSRSHAGDVENMAKAALGKQVAVEVITAAGSGYKTLEVIRDKADAYIHVTAIKKWDLCAPYALITAMGGTMTTLNGELIDFSGETEPLNTKGILASMKTSEMIENLKKIQIKE